MNLSKFTNSQKIILAGVVIAIVSLFMPWVETGVFSANGFQQEGYICLACFAYPTIMIFQQKNYNKKVSIIVLAIGLVFMLYFLGSKSLDLFGESVNCASTGIYVMIVGLIVSLVGVIKDKKQIYS